MITSSPLGGSQAGAYFVTIVTYQRDCSFGKIENEEMVLNDFGKIADECWRAIPEHFPNVELGAYVIMPNHVHGVVVIRDDESASDAVDAQHVGATQWVAPTNPNARPNGPKRGSLGAIIGSYKMAVTRRIQREHNTTGIWQRNYYEHIIRNRPPPSLPQIRRTPVVFGGGARQGGGGGDISKPPRYTGLTPPNGTMTTRIHQIIGGKIHSTNKPLPRLP
jgi:putative transposase